MIGVLFNFSNINSFNELIKVNESFYYAYKFGKSYSFFKTSLFYWENNNTDKLRIEYDTAIGCLQMIQKWQDIQLKKNTLPYLEFDAVIDDYSNKLETSLNKIVKHVDDPFWDIYFPINFFGDRSCIRQQSNVEPTNISVPLPKPKPGFQCNICKPYLISINEYFFVIHYNEENITTLKTFYC